MRWNGGRDGRGCLPRFRGADVTLTDVGDVDHITSLVLAVPAVARWFAALPGPSGPPHGGPDVSSWARR